MKIIHTADIHLGAAPDKKRPWSGAREKEIWQTFAGLVERVRQEKPDLFIIAGDLFHRPPLERELKEVSEYFSSLSPIPVVFIAGNHDYIRKNSCYDTFVWSENVFFLKDSEMNRVTIEELGADIYGLSYHDRTLKEPVYDTVPGLDSEKINILVAHGGDEDHAPIHFEKLLANGFDYIALGHFHKPAWNETANLAYPGSLEPTEPKETGEHGYMEVILEKGLCRAKLIPFAKRAYKEIVVCVNLDMTQRGLRNAVSEAISEEGELNLFNLVLRGERNPNLEIDTEEILLLGNIAKIEDETRISYDYERLKRENEDNILGMFIDSFLKTENSGLEQKALAYGVQALLEDR